MKAARAGLIIALLALGGCSAERTDPLCQVASLAVAAGMDGVHVVNQSGVACRFSGKFPVTLTVRLDGAGPPNAKGTLPAAGTYVQPYVAGSPAACPAPVPNVPHSLPANVEGVAVEATTQGTDAYFMANCFSFTAGVPRIEG